MPKPKLPPEMAKTKLFTMRFYENELPIIEKIAQERGFKNIAHYIRTLMRNDLKAYKIKNEGLKSII